MPWPIAALPQVADFIHPICNHRIRSPRCVDRRTWENSPPRCSVIVTHTRPCNHSKKMSCYEAAEEASHPRPCLADVEMRRPRCTHQLSLRCNAASSLKEAWAQHSAMGAVRAEASDPSSVTVEHGAVYGPSETQLAKEAGLHSIPECCLKVRYGNGTGAHVAGSTVLPWRVLL